MALLLVQRMNADAALHQAQAELEQRVQQRTSELSATNIALRDSEEQLRLATEAGHVGTFLIDPKAQIVHSSPELSRILGFPRVSETRLEDAFKRIHRDDEARARGLHQAAIAPNGNGQINSEFRFVRPGGEVRWLMCRARVLFEDRPTGREAVSYMGTCVDITERKLAEVEMERMQHLLTEGQRIAHVGSWEYIAATRETVWSDEEKRIFGLDPITPSPSYEELIQHLIHSEQAAEVDRSFHESFEKGAIFEHDHRIVRPDGSVRWVHNRAHPYFDADGKLVKYIGATLDITERKRHEEQIALLMDEVNHRSRNMLALVQAIAHRTASSGAGDYVKRFNERLDALAAAQDLLITNEWKAVSLADLVRSQLGHFADLIGTRITITGPSLWLRPGSVQTIGMALHELATNAAKHGALSTERGHVSITWDIVAHGTARPQFTLSWVEQDGPAVSTPQKRGYGTTLTTEMVKYNLGCEVSADFAASGLVWRLTSLASKIVDGQLP